MKKKKFPLWLQVILILLLGAGISTAIYLVGKDSKIPRYTVTFAYQDGTVIDKKEVKEGCGCFPPVCDTDDVFRGWSGAFNSVEADTETHPIFYEVTDDVNLFYFNSVYVREGKKFTIDINLTGNINVSKGTLTLSYDTDVMKYIKSENQDYVSVKDNGDGTLTVTFDSDNPINAKTTLSSLTFKSFKVDAYSSEIDLESNNVKLVDGKEEKNADNATINNKIYFLQEVN